MGNKILGVVLACALFGCGGEDVPSCQQAMTHFYEVGCWFGDLSTDPPTPYTVNESIMACQEVNQAVPDRCQDHFDDFMFCLNGATASTCEDCSQEQDALFGCD